MQQRVLEIIEFLLREFSKLQDAPTSQLEQISEKLLEKGYTEPEIRTAVDWLMMQVEGRAKARQRSRGQSRPGALRLLSAEEKALLGKSAYGYLIHLQTMGLLPPDKVERIIERCFMASLDMEAGEMKSVIVQMLAGQSFLPARPGGYFHPGNENVH